MTDGVERDYRSVDLASYRNAGRQVLGSPLLPVGDVDLRGLPFSIGGAEGAPAYVLLGPEGITQPIRLRFDRPARTILVAHLLVDTHLPEGGPAGVTVAEYVIGLAGGTEIVVPVRETLEISVRGREDFIPSIEWYAITAAFLAPTSDGGGLYPRRSGPWDKAGARMAEEGQGFGGYRIWWWRDEAGREARDLEIRPRGTPFVIAGITVGELDEDPIPRTAQEPVTITILDPAAAPSDEDLDLLVDRGVASYTWPLVPEADGAPGWGQPVVPGGPRYAEVAAIPSATLEVIQGDRILGAVRWSDVIDGRAEDPGRVRIEWVDRTRQWVHTTVVDDDTNRPIPCRIHFRSASGIPWQPHGHHSHVNGDMSSWHMDVGGDVRLGAISYAVIDGRCQGWLPEGEVTVEVVRGFEYEPLRTVVEIRPGQRELQLRLRRWADLRTDGWVSGDTHVHFLGVSGAHLEAAAEDLAVVNILQAQWGRLFTNTEDFTGEPSISRDGQTIVSVGQENRQPVLGHLGLLGPRVPIMPWSSGGPSEAELGSAMEVTLADWADEGRRIGALVTLPHIAIPNGETPALIATGRIDAIEMISLAAYCHAEYYRYLDAGYRVPLVGGTHKMSNEVPVGIYRTYARVERDEPLTFESWSNAVRAGRTFLSGGPILRLRVDGADIGDTIRMGGAGGTVAVEGTAESNEPIGTLQIVVGGRVVAEAVGHGAVRRLDIRERIAVEPDSWIALRAGGPNYFDGRAQHDAFRRAVFAHTSPIYVRGSSDAEETTDEETLQYLLTRVEAIRSYVATRAPTVRLGGGGHLHGQTDHMGHLLRPFDEAREALLRRRRPT